MNQTNKKGFTLVELSIVLVIIGLLIGGILVGQSLIESAKMQSFIRQIGQYDAAVGIFKDKFGNLPGDNALFGTSVAAGGAGNGNITDDDGALLLFSGEIGGFWADLSSAGLKNEDGASFTASRAGAHTDHTPGTHVPKVGIGQNSVLFAYGTGNANYYHLSADAASVAAIVTADALIPADAVAVDSKLDDGVATTGNVMMSDAVVLALTLTDNASTTCTNAGVYNITATALQCQVRIRMGTSTGVLQ